MTEYPEELIKFYNENRACSSVIHKSLSEARNDTSCVFYPIEFNFDQKLLLDECRSIDHLYVSHRSQDSKNGYGHRGWNSITLHGIDQNKTEHYTKYGFSNLEEANYKWTDVCSLIPTITEFVQSLPYDKFDRVRIMRLEPKGYIMPHADGPGRIFSPLNIAINNPQGCDFIFKNAGIVPFKAGTGMVLDIAREHSVINNSDQARYHIIVHGYYNKKFNYL